MLERANIIDPSINKRLAVSNITKTRLFTLASNNQDCCTQPCSSITLNTPFSFEVRFDDLFDVDYARIVAGSCDFFLFYYTPDNVSWTQLEPHSCTECKRVSVLNNCEFIDASFSVNDSVGSVSYDYVVLTSSATSIEVGTFELLTWDVPWLVVEFKPIDRYDGLIFKSIVSITNTDGLPHDVFLSLRADGSEVSRSTVIKNGSTSIYHCMNNHLNTCAAGSNRFGTEFCRFDCASFTPSYLIFTLPSGGSTEFEVVVTRELDFDELPIVIEVEV